MNLMVYPDAPAITLIVVPIAIVIAFYIIKGIRWSFEKRVEYLAKPYKGDPSIELGCLITWWLLLLFWSPPIGFGIGVIVALVGGAVNNHPVDGILVSLGCLDICLLTGWFAIKMSFILADYE